MDALVSSASMILLSLHPSPSSETSALKARSPFAAVARSISLPLFESTTTSVRRGTLLALRANSFRSRLAPIGGVRALAREYRLRPVRLPPPLAKYHQPPTKSGKRRG